MNIVVNCRLLQQGKLEGIGWFTYENLKRITVSHPEHHFWFIFDRPYSDEFIFAPNVTGLVMGPPTRHPLLWYLWFEWRMPGLLRKLKADLFFSPDGYLSLRSTVPQIPVIHDINFAHRPKDLPWMTRRYYNHFFPLFARKGKRICTVSKYSKKDIHKTYQVAKPLIHVVYNGANPDFKPLDDNQKAHGRMRFANGHPYFIFIGSIHPRKNLHNLILAFNRFQQESPSDVHLLVVGTHMWKTRKEVRASNFELRGASNFELRTSNILFTGHLGSDDLRLALGSALALTFVPWFEGFGIPVLEAMQSGVPVLTSTETSLPEVGEQAVLYAHPSDVDGMAAQMQKLAEDSALRQRLVDGGLEQAKKFSWDHTARKVWKCIHTVLISHYPDET